jgi:hypothetical protein
MPMHGCPSLMAPNTDPRIRRSVVGCSALNTLDSSTVCGISTSGRDSTPNLCPIHHEEYKQSYRAYTAAKEKAAAMVRSGMIPSREQISGMGDASEVAKSQAWVESYLEALCDEKSGREAHSKRFFNTRSTYLRF